MIRRILCSFIICLFALPSLGQDLDSFKAVQEMVTEYRQINHKAPDSYYFKYKFMLEHLGLFRLNLEKMKLPNGAEVTVGVNNLKGFHDRLRKAQSQVHSLSEAASNKQLALLRDARHVFAELKSFANTDLVVRGEEIVARFEGEPFSYKKSLKAGMKHLGPEFLRFGGAIAILRIAQCYGFGESMISNLQFRGPGWLSNKLSDPACMTEIGQMLTDPLFYAGFSAFIIGSRLFNPLVMNHLARLNPSLTRFTREDVKQGKISKSQYLKSVYTHSMQRYILPQLAMSVGFVADHSVRTLLSNQYVKGCLKKTFTGNTGTSADIFRDANGVAVTANGDQIYDGSKNVNKDCKKMWRNILSSQFLVEEMAVGVAGLVAAGVTLAGGNAALSAATGRIYHKMMTASSPTAFTRAFQKLGKIVSISLNGNAIGLTVKRMAHLIAFLGIAEVLHHHVINPTYHLTYLQPVTDKRNRELVWAMNGQRPPTDWDYEIQEEQGVEAAIEDYLKRDDLENQRQEYIDSEVNKKFSFIGKKAILSPYAGQKCTKHYAGVSEDGNLKFCTKFPLLAEMQTLGEYASQWRAKKVLGEFHKYFQRWNLKMTSFLNRYFGSLNQLQILSRSREIWLNNQKEKDFKNTSEFFEVFNEKASDGVNHLLVQSMGGPDFASRGEAKKQDFQERIQLEQLTDYKDPLSEGSNNNPEVQAYKLFKSIHNMNNILEYNQIGGLWDGLPLNEKQMAKSLLDPDYIPWPAQQIANMILYFIEGKEWRDWIEVEDPKSPSRMSINLRTREDIQNTDWEGEGVHEINYLPHLVPLLKSKDPEKIATALVQWQEWSPYMYGPQQRFYGEEDPNYNDRGMRLKRYQYYQSINKLLDDYGPTFPYEYIYLNLVGMSRPEQAIADAEKSHEDVHWSKKTYSLDTSSLGRMTLVNMMCGEPPDVTDFFRGVVSSWTEPEWSGFSLFFDIPHLREDNLCYNLFFPVSDLDSQYENYTSPIYSTFLAPNDGGHYVGLHQAYIQAPQDSGHPMVFKSERQAEDWWNKSVVPKSLKTLGLMKKDYFQMIQEKFKPHIRDPYKYSGFTGWLRWGLKKLPLWFSEESEEKRQEERLVTMDNLEESFINELYHYNNAAQIFLDSRTLWKIGPNVDQMPECIGKLLDAIVSNNYKAEAERCEKLVVSVKKELWTDSAAEEEKLEKTTDEELVNAQNPEELIRLRLKEEYQDRISGIFDEIKNLDNMINKSFQFDLLQGEPQ